MRLAVSFTNFGPYHLARLRALGTLLNDEGGELVAIETAGQERKYPWQTERGEEPFRWITLFPGRSLESIPASECASAIREELDLIQPDALGIVGYVRPECLAALDWSQRYDRPSVLMSESQAIDRPRTWWKEAIKGRRVRRFDAALVGGASHRDYLQDLGFPAERIALGYNAVDNDQFTRLADEARRDPTTRTGLPDRPYFLTAARFAPEKNLPALVRAFARLPESRSEAGGWDLVLCGSGSQENELQRLINDLELSERVHCPGFLQADALARWYAWASAFVLPSLSEPWGLVANEAAACGLPLLLSKRAGCAGTLVPDPMGMTGLRFDPLDELALADALAWVVVLSEPERIAIGQKAAEVVAAWGPERFARGTLQAVDLARQARQHRKPSRAVSHSRERIQG